MKHLLRKILAPARSGAGEIFHPPSAVQKSGWRDFPEKEERARFAERVGRSSPTRNPQVFAALTALADSCSLQLSRPADRDFLIQSLWEVGQASGGCGEAFQEVAVLAGEGRVDWREERERFLVLEYLREIRQGTTTVNPWSSLSTACRRPGFDLGDPGQRWALLSPRHPLPGSTPLDSLEPAVAACLAAIRRDQRLAGANTIRRYLAALGETEKTGLAAIAGSAEFIRWFLAGESAPLPLPATLRPARLSPRRLNRHLRELSLRLHLENGAPFILLQAREEEGRLTLVKDFLDLPPRPLDLRPGDEVSFRQALTASGEEGLFRSCFAGTVTDLAIMTHNRARILETLRVYAANLLAYGHGGSGVRIHVFDDSTDSGREERQGAIAALGAAYAGQGIPVCYWGPEEKARLREQYTAELARTLPPAEAGNLREGIAAAIGEGGKGAQRNWIALELGGGNVAMIDDDVYPWVELAPGWGARRVEVDLLAILNRAAAVPGALAVCSTYSGVPDWGEGDALQLHYRKLRFGVAWQGASLPTFVYAGTAHPDRPPRAYHQENWNPVTQGGVLAILGRSQGLASRVPSAATLVTDLHIQDFVMGCVQDLLSRRQANENSWTLSPHGAVHHGRDQRGRSANKIRTALDEGVGAVFGRLIPLIAGEAGEDLFAGGSRPAEVMSSLGRSIADWLEGGKLNPELMRRPVEEGIPLGEGILSVLAYLRRLYEATGRRGWLYYPQRQSYRSAIAALFGDFSWQRLLAPDASLELSGGEWQPVLDILRQELLGYAHTLRLWPALTGVADARKAQGGEARPINRTGKDC